MLLVETRRRQRDRTRVHSLEGINSNRFRNEGVVGPAIVRKTETAARYTEGCMKEAQ